VILRDLQALCDASALHRELAVHVSDEDGGLLVDATVPSRWLGDGTALAIHGGLIATVVDAAAVMFLIAATGDDWYTVDLRLDYLRPVVTSRMRVKSEHLHAGRSLARVHSRLEDANGVVAVVATGTFRRGERLSQIAEEEL
jgi:uncharacterized protein (TIGR00369 family)